MDALRGLLSKIKCTAQLGAVRNIGLGVGLFFVPYHYRRTAARTMFTLWQAADWQGVLVDLFVTLVFFTLLLLLARVAYRLAVGLCMLWLLFHCANFEHIRTLGDIAALSQAEYVADYHFMLATVSGTSYLEWVVLGTLVLGLLGIWGLKQVTFRAVTGALAATTLVGITCLSTVTQYPEIARWRQTHLFVEAIRLACLPETESVNISTGATSLPSRVHSLFRADLKGTPRLKLGRRGENVLLIVLEGICGAHVTPVRQAWNVDDRTQMPFLSRLSEANLCWTYFVHHQRQTNRGLWSLLAGTYDKLLNGPPKMTEYLWNPARRCLPHFLREAGYETVFLQAARLRFMHKDRFMPLAGFSQVIGDESFGQDLNRSRWGIDDHSLFRKAREKIGELEQGDKPWFMTILTVGTHHPYATPANCLSSFPRGTFEHAAACADQALEELLTGLEREGILQNTIVLVTSDESGGLRQESDDLALRLSRNWGFLTVVTPEKQRRRIDEPFLQSDVALSVLDYLGISDVDHPFGGRSVFRSYREKRPLFFGNVYHNHVVGLDVDGRLIIVDDAMQQGQAYDIGDQCLFMATRKAADFAPADREFVRSMAVHCSHDATASGTRETFRR